MKKNIFFIVCLAVVCMSLSSCSYNKLTDEEQEVESAWSEVENQYQRRMDLIPNLVNVVKGYAKHEEQTFTEVVEARNKASQVNINAEDLDEEGLEKLQQVQDKLSSGLGRLMAISEAYPELKSNENFLQLQAQLEGTENRIAVARRNFNEAAKKYNADIKKFPTMMYAGMMGFQNKPYFRAKEGADEAPKVEF